MHALPDSARSVDLQPLGDLVVTARQLVPGRSVLARPAKFGTHPSDESCPALRWRPNTRAESRLARRGDVLADRVPIQPQALRDRPQRPSRRPMLQHLYDVCHPQTPSCHSHSSARVVANGPKRRLRGGELAEHPGGELPEHFGSAWWNYLNADIRFGELGCRSPRASRLLAGALPTVYLHRPTGFALRAPSATKCS